MAPHFGKWLREQIASSGKPILAFSAEINVSEGSLHRWLRSSRPNIRDYLVTRIAGALQLSRKDVLAELHKTAA